MWLLNSLCSVLNTVADMRRNLIHALRDAAAVAAAKSHQSCPTLCDPTDGSPPGSLIPGILQARTLEWVAISFFPLKCTNSKGESRVPLEVC